MRWLWQAPNWPELRYDAASLSRVVAAARQAQGHLRGKTEALDSLGQLPAESQVWTEEALATAAIEGEALDPVAVRSSIARRLGLAGPRVAVPRAVEGLLDLMQDAAHNWNAALTKERLCRWQAALFPTGRSGLTRIAVGAYRRGEMQIVSGPLGHETVHYEAVPGAAVNAEMRALIHWFNTTGKSGEHDGVVRAGLAHLWLETVHPFEDGNGRVGRALIDLALAQDARAHWRMHGLAQRLMKDREAYYEALNQAQRGGVDVTGWLRWFLRTFESACKDSLVIVDEAVERGQYWAKFHAADLSGNQRKAVAKLLDAGKGGFEGGMTPRKFASLTHTSAATATRELSDLVSKGMLVRMGAGRSTRYELPMPDWQWKPAQDAPETAT